MNDLWLYLSFIDDEGFLGGMYVPQAADDVFEDPIWEAQFPEGYPKATKMAVRLIPSDQVPEDHKWHGRLLSHEELVEATEGRISRYGDLRKAAEGGIN